MTDALPTIDEHKRRILFVPVPTKKALHAWIMEFLGLDIPDTLVDPSSNCSPMDLLWEIYEAARDNNRPDFSRVIAYASRDSFKTLCAAVLEVLMMVHLRRNVAHMAATEGQAQKAQSYVLAFLSKPFLRDYLSGSNERAKAITRYYNPKTGTNLNADQFEDLTIVEKLQYEEISNYIKIVICTPKGANSEHVPFFVVDEVDLASPVAYQEAKMIPGAHQGQLPITLLTSTRKYSFGLVQKELDNAEETGTHVRHWNIMDVMEKCPKERHRPDLPMVDAYVKDEDLSAIGAAEYEALSADAKTKYEPDRAFAGCIKNCKMFAFCRGRSATKQKAANPNARVRSLLKPVSVVQATFKSLGDAALAKAQLLCRKPSTLGLIYPNFDREVHMITAAQMAEMLTGDEFPDDFTKEQLIQLMKTREVRFASGMDFGYTHRFAVVTGAIDGNRCFVFDVISIAEIELEQQIESCDRVKELQSRIAADSASPQSIKTFAKRGFRIKGVDKAKGSVLGGIDIVRSLLRPGLGMPPRLYFLKGDPGCELMAKRISMYHWMLDKDGEPSDIPDDTDDDECDALRYLMMSTFAKNGKVMAAKDGDPPPPTQQPNVMAAPPPQTWMKDAIRSNLGERAADDPGASGSTGRKGSFFWDV